MMKTISSKNAFFLLAALVFIIVTFRAILVPFAHDETATFFYYIQNGDFLPYISHLDANNHILNSFLSWICFRLFGDSPFSLRLPNIFGLVVLIIAVYRLTNKLIHPSAKIILVAGFLVSFHWLSFFNLCRGYGISMAFMLLAFTYILNYIESNKMADILKIYVLLDLAVCANLTLIIVVAFITALICFFQLYRRSFFIITNISMLFVHTLIILFWVKYSFFLQHLDLLYAGSGDSYWKVTFVSLIYAIVGKENFWIAAFIVSTYLILMFVSCYIFIKNSRNPLPGNLVFTLFLAILLNGLILGFYLLKKLFGINFPEDRAGLSFYVLFILNAAFITDYIKPYFSNIIAMVTLAIFTLHFAWNINFYKHSLDMYEVIPERFYDRLLDEQKQNPEKITIGGHRLREFFYAFMNYRHNGALNLVDPPDRMLMNADYYIGLKRDRKYYAPYYSEIDTDKDYGFTLLKRKQPLVRNLLSTINSRDIEMTKDKEYANLFEIRDTAYKSPNPLLVEFNFKVQSGDMPSACWIVLNIDSAEGKTLYYRRIPLNWVRYNWLNMEQSTDMIMLTGPLPPKIHRFVCYLWNFQGQRLKITMNSVKIFQIEGSGSNFDSYPAENITVK